MRGVLLEGLPLFFVNSMEKTLHMHYAVIILTIEIASKSANSL